jgi:hypothetical protein
MHFLQTLLPQGPASCARQGRTGLDQVGAVDRQLAGGLAWGWALQRETGHSWCQLDLVKRGSDAVT